MACEDGCLLEEWRGLEICQICGEVKDDGE